MKFLRKTYFVLKGCIYSVITCLPAELNRLRVMYLNSEGCRINRYSSISSNVRIKGNVTINRGSSVAQNCTISGESAGIYIGENVMIAPNVTIVAFDHGYQCLKTPMTKQKNIEKAVFISDDVWIGANSTISKGVNIGKGAIVGANSFVNKDVKDFDIVGGVPARIIGTRKDLANEIQHNS